MKNMRLVTLLSVLIIAFAAIAAGAGLLLPGGPGEHSVMSVRGESITLYGKGLYKNESVSMAAQAKGQDMVTLALGIPLLCISLIMTGKRKRNGHLLLAGTLGYFLYTYASYAFLSMYNPMFLIYTVLFSVSLFAFIFTLNSLQKDRDRLFKDTLPVKRIGIFLLFIGCSIGLLWLGKILRPDPVSGVPLGLEHYSTLVIQAMDLGVVVPLSIAAGVLVLQRKTIGFLLASVMIVKGISLLTAITAMLGAMLYAGVNVSLAELILFPGFTIWALYNFVLLLKHTRKLA
ncbi:hypothetical protein [Paenibacillus rhizophilus]|uniref:Uncharacterized protein n=1 Tax=Paenibacillus rhizophilus TaxID=1850366 RepID=A0A3N9PCV0_9BACL|nr:hypothetical protein [Paenibacillus rhizophilus]RQW13330.1 hypothetical protein EH198_02550 [Paenibacillus rhizophilus]